MKELRIGICGLGTVGSAVVNVFQQNAEIIARKVTRPVAIELIGARRNNPNCDTGDIPIATDVLHVGTSDDVDVVIELIGGTTIAKEVIETALHHGKHVVTANKALIAQHGNGLIELAQSKGLALLFEAAVAGGIPILQNIRDALRSNKIESVTAIINGTCNYILSSIAATHAPFDDTLELAKQAGYAEADPTFDIEGIDAAHKLTILASMAFGTHLNFAHVHTKGITNIQPIDFIHATKFGYTIKHLGIAKQIRINDTNYIDMRVEPVLIPITNPLASIDGATNAVLLHSYPLGESIAIGQGAGGPATASAVINDVLSIAMNSNLHHPLGFPSSMIENIPALPDKTAESAFYLRLHTSNQLGVLASITKVLAEHAINTMAIHQDQACQNKIVPILVLTAQCSEQAFLNAKQSISSLDDVSFCTHLRIEA